MLDIAAMLQQGATNAWLFIPSAILLGALHGLEPGHSKTMMAAFIVAIRGSVGQAIMLGLAATLSHTAVVWAVALTGMYLGSQWNAETIEPYFQVASAVLIIAVAGWMIWRTARQQSSCGHDHSHDHHDHDQPKARFQFRAAGHSHHHHDHSHHDHSHHDHSNHGHHHSHTHGSHAPLVFNEADYQDAHELAHAKDIQKRFSNRQVTNGQILLFGLTGGLVPCPAAITVLLLCLQLKKITLGATLVLGFSIGLALTLVMSGVLAAVSVHHAAKRFSGFGEFARRAPYFSGGLIMLVGFYVGYQGLHALL